MKILSAIVVSSLICSVGCIPEHEENICQGSWRIESEDFSAHERDLIQESANRWNEYAGKQVLTISDIGICPIKRGEYKVSSSAHYSHDGFIEVNTKLDCETDICWLHMMMHEFGHSLGYRHTEDGIMAEKWNDTTTF